jgi:anti-sigma B factor antagonist
MTVQGCVTVLLLCEPSLDASNANELKKIVRGIVESSPFLVLDLRQVQFIDSSGCGAILTALRWLEQVRGSLRICGLSEQVRKTFALSRMNRILDIYPTREEALKSLACGAVRS